MSYQRERDIFMARAGSDLGLETATKLLRYATTLQRLAVAQCNGDYPADNGERKTELCPTCARAWVPSSIRGGKSARMSLTGKACPDCRTERAVHDLLEGSAWQPYFQGDPRGAVLQIFSVNASFEDMDSGRAHSLAVPVRS